MKKYSSFGLLAVGAVALLAAAAPASANNVLYDQSSSFPATGTATQTDRLNRGGVPQDFSGTEAYPGTNTTAINETGTFNYITVTLSPAQLAGGPYVQIELDTQGLGLFASAYANSYTPPSASNPGGSFQTNYLGDEGSSGDYAFSDTPNGTPDVSFFGVTVPVGDSLVVVLATAGTVDPTSNIAAGAGTAYNLEVENFSTTEYGPVASAVPEPSSFAAVGAGLVSLGFAARRRFGKASLA